MRRLLALAIEPSPSGSWLTEAACVGEDPEPFFHADPSTALGVCRDCPSTGSCLEYALANRLNYGVWGATTPAQRETIAKERGIRWEPEPPAQQECAGRCGRWARPARSRCSACAQRALRASRR